jgi:tetratricopeptide (TPR) repeat protein
MGLAIYQFSSYFEQDKYNEAIACLDKAISLAPNDPEAWYYKGLFIRDHYLLGKYDDDMSHFKSILKLENALKKL